MAWSGEAPAVRPVADGAVVEVRVSTRKPQARLNGIREGRLEVWLHSPAQENRANRELERLIAGLAHLPPSQVEVVAGAKARNKSVLVRGLSATELADALFRAAGGAG